MEKTQSKTIITVVGKDTVGIIARFGIIRTAYQCTGYFTDHH